MTRADEHQTVYVGTQNGSEIGDVSCSCGWQICELDPVKADAAVMRHLTDEGVIV